MATNPNTPPPIKYSNPYLAPGMVAPNPGIHPITPPPPQRPRFFNPESISYDQYSKGAVDFYNQALDTSSGINVDTIGEGGDSSDDTGDQRPDIRGAGGTNDDDKLSVLTNTMGVGTTPAFNVTNYDLNDINFGNTHESLNTYDFTSPGTMTMDKSTGDMNYSFSTMLDDYQEGVTAAGKAMSAQKTSGGKFRTDSFTGMKESIMSNVDAALGATTVGKPFGKGVAGIDPGVAGFMNPAAPLMGLFGGMSVAQQARNAAAFQATNGMGGALMDVNGMMVSRMPGESTFFGFASRNAMGGMRFNYAGNLMGLSNDQMAALEAQRNGFLPGTLTETFDPLVGNYVKGGVKSTYMDSDVMAQVGGAYDPATGRFVDSFGNVSAQGTKKASEAYVSGLNKMFGSKLDYGAVSQGRAAARRAGVPFEQYMENLARQSTKTSGLVAKVTARTAAETAAKTDADRAREQAIQAAADQRAKAAVSMIEDDGYDPGDDTYGAADDEMGDVGIGGGGDFTADDDDDYDDLFADGGRVGMQMGGPAGFVERPPSQVADSQTVADDVPATVGEGTFVINAPAVEFAGEADIRKLLDDAYAKVAQRGIASPTQEQIDIAVSRGEVIIPPEVAKEIGYDKLNKINNRGKKEVSRRQAERQGKSAAGGGFISKKK